MKQKLAFFSISLFAFVASALAQSVPQQLPPQVAYDPPTSMAYDVARIAASVQTMTKTLKDFVDKFAKPGTITLNERQQRLVTGMQLLMQAEQRMATLEKRQVELAEKEGQIRGRIAQVEAELNPQRIDRSVTFEGSTQAPELREIRRRAMQADLASLQTLMQQVNQQVQGAGNDAREAQSLVNRLRLTYLPRVERELSEP